MSFRLLQNFRSNPSAILSPVRILHRTAATSCQSDTLAGQILIANNARLALIMFNYAHLRRTLCDIQHSAVSFHYAGPMKLVSIYGRQPSAMSLLDIDVALHLFMVSHFVSALVA